MCKKKIVWRKYKKLLFYVELKKLIRLIFNCIYIIIFWVRYGCNLIGYWKEFFNVKLFWKCFIDENYVFNFDFLILLRL